VPWCAIFGLSNYFVDAVLEQQMHFLLCMLMTLVDCVCACFERLHAEKLLENKCWIGVGFQLVFLSAATRNSLLVFFL
jgi:hypothetical protein